MMRMTGNATEEWLMTRLDYPGHIDAGRIAGLGGSISGIVSGLVVKSYLGAPVAVVIGIVLGLSVGGLLFSLINRRAADREAAKRNDARARHEMETERQIKMMNAARAKRRAIAQ